MRHLSIPRLKLQVAVMALKLKEQIVKEHKMNIIFSSFFVKFNDLNALDTQLLSLTTSLCFQSGG